MKNKQKSIFGHTNHGLLFRNWSSLLTQVNQGSSDKVQPKKLKKKKKQTAHQIILAVDLIALNVNGLLTIDRYEIQPTVSTCLISVKLAWCHFIEGWRGVPLSPMELVCF